MEACQIVGPLGFEDNAAQPARQSGVGQEVGKMGDDEHDLETADEKSRRQQ